jgi:hypothetical protein
MVLAVQLSMPKAQSKVRHPQSSRALGGTARTGLLLLQPWNRAGHDPPANTL